MNKILVSFAFLCLFTFTAMAQNSAITNAILYHKDNVLDKAKQEIDQAVAHDKTKAEPKAWYYKGVICTDISRSKNPSHKTLCADPLKEAIDAYSKSMELDAAKGEYYKLSESRLGELWADVINKGIAEYEMEDSKAALVSFEMAQKMRPADTSAYIYACYAAESLRDEAALKKNTDALVAMNYYSPYVYRNRIYLEKDLAKRMAIAEEGSVKYPGDEALREILGDTYSENGKYEQALNSYKILNVMMPENVTILTKMALQNEKLKKPNEALTLYEKILTLDKLNFIANYNSAIIYFEKGKEENDRVHKLTVDEYHKQGKQMEDEINKLFNSALNHANTALTQTNDATDIGNIKLMIGEINKVIKK